MVFVFIGMWARVREGGGETMAQVIYIIEMGKLKWQPYTSHISWPHFIGQFSAKVTVWNSYKFLKLYGIFEEFGSPHSRCSFSFRIWGMENIIFSLLLRLPYTIKTENVLAFTISDHSDVLFIWRIKCYCSRSHILILLKRHTFVSLWFEQILMSVSYHLCCDRCLWFLQHEK